MSVAFKFSGVGGAESEKSKCVNDLIILEIIKTQKPAAVTDLQN